MTKMDGAAPRFFIIGALLFAAFVVLIGMLFPPDVSDVIRQGVAVALTTTMLICYSPFVPAIIKWGSVQSFHLLGAGVWLMAFAFWLPNVRVRFLNVACPVDSTCQRTAEFMMLIALAVSLGFMLSAPFSRAASTSLDRRLIWASLAIGAVAGLAALIIGLT